MTVDISVKMKEGTLQQVDRLQTRVHAPSRSDTIRRAVEISDLLVEAVEHGDKIIIQSKNGKQTEVLITGLNQ